MLLAIGLLSAVLTDGWQTGNNLLVKCQDEKSLGECIGYIEGVVDASHTVGAAFPSGPIVMPGGVTKGQVKDIVVAYLQRHPDQRHNAASDLVYIALKVAFDPK